MARNILLVYSNYYKSFEVHTDVKRYPARSDYHIAFYREKLTKVLKLSGSIKGAAKHRHIKIILAI